MGIITRGDRDELLLFVSSYRLFYYDGGYWKAILSENGGQMVGKNLLINACHFSTTHPTTLVVRTSSWMVASFN